MKPQHFAVLAGTLLLAALILLVTGRPQQAAGTANTLPPRLVSVVGEGEVRVKPDLVHLNFGVMTHGASAKEAEALNLASVNRVRAALVEAGLDDATLDTSLHDVTTESYQDYAGATRIGGFAARSLISGVLRSPGKTQAAIEAALGAGATSVEEITYDLASPDEVRRQAMTKALENARIRAGALANADGQTLGDVRQMEVLPEEKGHTPGGAANGLVFRTRLKVTFQY